MLFIILVSGSVCEEASSAVLWQLLNISTDPSTLSSTKYYLEVTLCVLCVCFPRVCPLTPVLSQGVWGTDSDQSCSHRSQTSGVWNESEEQHTLSPPALLPLPPLRPLPPTPPSVQKQKWSDRKPITRTNSYRLKLKNYIYFYLIKCDFL